MPSSEMPPSVQKFAVLDGEYRVLQVLRDLDVTQVGPVIDAERAEHRLAVAVVDGGVLVVDAGASAVGIWALLYR